MRLAPLFAPSWWRQLTILGLCTCLIVALAGCGNSSVAGTPLDERTATGTLDGQGENLVVFMPTTSNSYIKADADAIRSEAAELNYEVMIYENDFDQTEQNQQVQDWIASGQEAAAVLFWPATAEAATNSIRQLSRMAPVIQFNQTVQPDAEEFVTAYAGVSDYAIGEQAGLNALAEYRSLRDAGTSFHGPDGTANIIEFRFPTGYAAGDNRHDSFVDATGEAFNMLAVEPVTAPDAQAGFDAASQIVPKFKGQGIDFIYAQNNNIATGVVQALKQNGLEPGVDVIVVAGDFSGDKQPLRRGEIHSAIIQSPVIEGMLLTRTAAQYIATLETKEGVHQIPDMAEKPETELEPPFETTYMMNPTVTAENIEDITIWGMDVNQLVK